MPRRLLIATLLAAVLVAALPAVAMAAEKSRAETGTYDLDFTLPTAGKSGCLVCHEDENLVRFVDGETQSMYVDVEILRGSAHAEVACTKCHIDFAFKAPHENAADDETWRTIANLSCKGSGCHDEQFTDINQSAHTTSLSYQEDGTPVSNGEDAEGELRVPLCGDCHGGHDIKVLTDNPAGQAELHSQGLEMCGECHEAEAGTYEDYYHGAAYRRGAPDAPACWECHEAHLVLPSADRRSSTHPDNLNETCGSCHIDVNDEYVAYAEFIHGRETVLSDNPAWSFIAGVRETIRGAFYEVTSWFGASS